MEHAPHAFSRRPHRVTFAGCGVGNPDRPRTPGASSAEDFSPRDCWQPEKRDRSAVRRPHRVLIPVEPRRQISQRARTRVVHTDERVIAPHAHEREARSVRRPPEVAQLPARVQQLRRRIAAAHPDLILMDERDGRRSSLGLTAGAELARRAAAQRRDPRCLARRPPARMSDWEARRRDSDRRRARRRRRCRPTANGGR